MRRHRYGLIGETVYPGRGRDRPHDFDGPPPTGFTRAHTVRGEGDGLEDQGPEDRAWPSPSGRVVWPFLADPSARPHGPDFWPPWKIA